MASLTPPTKMVTQKSTAASVIPRSNAPRTTQVETNSSQLALTAQALESWGNKRVSWGRTHTGKRFAEIYEEQASYVDWITARARTATPAMQDFITYCQARQDMESQAVRGRR